MVSAPANWIPRKGIVRLSPSMMVPSTRTTAM
jgi:hypothetical protein